MWRGRPTGLGEENGVDLMSSVELRLSKGVCVIEFEGVVHNGVIVLDDATALPDGTRVRINVSPVEEQKSFGERFAKFEGVLPGLPVDLAEQHDHYRLGTPKR